jgi:hypothetical protein
VESETPWFTPPSRALVPLPPELVTHNTAIEEGEGSVGHPYCRLLLLCALCAYFSISFFGREDSMARKMIKSPGVPRVV